MATTFQEYHEELTQYLVEAIVEGSSAPSTTSSDDILEALVLDLVSAIPYYDQPGYQEALRLAVGTQLAMTLPNSSNTPEPDHQEGQATYEYYYTGNYSGYRDAFYHRINNTPVQQRLETEVTLAAPELGQGWWEHYSVALLTDAIHQDASVSINSTKLNDELQLKHREFIPGLSPSYYAVFMLGYLPTASAYDAIVQNGNLPAAAQILNDSISSPLFQTNFNAVIHSGGNGMPAAEWYLFNLWISLKALGMPDVDGAILEHTEEGLDVPSSLGPTKWWRGDYNNWFAQMDGSAVIEPAPSVIVMDFPEDEKSYYPGHGYLTEHVSLSNGYGKSFCQWGNLNYYYSG